MADKSPLVLVVEDDDNDFAMHAALLRQAKITFVRAGTVAEAKAAFRTHPSIRLVIVDVLFRDSTGDLVPTGKYFGEWVDENLDRQTDIVFVTGHAAALDSGTTLKVAKELNISGGLYVAKFDLRAEYLAWDGGRGPLPACYAPILRKARRHGRDAGRSTAKPILYVGFAYPALFGPLTWYEFVHGHGPVAPYPMAYWAESWRVKQADCPAVERVVAVELRGGVLRRVEALENTQDDFVQFEFLLLAAREAVDSDKPFVSQEAYDKLPGTRTAARPSVRKALSDAFRRMATKINKKLVEAGGKEYTKSLTPANGSYRLQFDVRLLVCTTAELDERCAPPVTT